MRWSVPSRGIAITSTWMRAPVAGTAGGAGLTPSATDVSRTTKTQSPRSCPRPSIWSPATAGPGLAGGGAGAGAGDPLAGAGAVASAVAVAVGLVVGVATCGAQAATIAMTLMRSEEHTSELQSRLH